MIVKSGSSQWSQRLVASKVKVIQVACGHALYVKNTFLSLSLSVALANAAAPSWSPRLRDL
jgi:hypothetical protein